MAQVRRYDRAELKPPVRTDAGFLRADAYLTRVGVFEYRKADGSVRRELRMPEEVFKADSLDSLQAAPLTLLHPDTAVTPENVRNLSVGAVGTDVRQDIDKVRATVTVMAADAIQAVENGMRELSCGYDCTLEETPGVYNGEPYDAIQRGIKYNHLAIVPEGRAGPEVRLHLDAADAVMVRKQAPGGGQKGSQAMAVIRIDSVDFEAPPQTAQAVTAKLDAMQKRLDEAEKEREDLEEQKEKLDEDLEKLKAERDQLKDELEKLKAEDESEEAKAQKADSIRAAVKARVALERQAAPILGAEAKLDEMDDLAIKQAVIAKLSPSAKLDGKSEVYIQARYDAAIEQAASKPNTALGQLRQVMDSADGSVPDSEKARRDMIDQSRQAWQEPVMGRKAGA